MDTFIKIQSYFTPRGSVPYYVLIYKEFILGLFKTFEEAREYQNYCTDLPDTTIQLLRTDPVSNVVCSSWDKTEVVNNVKELLIFCENIPRGSPKGFRVGMCEVVLLYIMLHPQLSAEYPMFYRACETKATELAEELVNVRLEQYPSTIIQQDFPAFLKAIRTRSDFKEKKESELPLCWNQAVTAPITPKPTHNYNLRSRRPCHFP